GAPMRRNKLSLKFLQKKETKRALDFSETQADEPKNGLFKFSSCDQVVPGPSPCPASPGFLLPSDKKENLVPFVGLNNLGNTCYLNSVLQVLYYCPGLRDGMKKLHKLSKRRAKPKKEETNEQSAEVPEDSPPQVELLASFNSLIASIEQLQSGFLRNPDSFGDELATPPRKILHTLRQLNPMYEGYLQHDAQEVLQCILGYIQEACDTIRREQGLNSDDTAQVKEESGGSAAEAQSSQEDESQGGSKRKSDTEVGNAKKKPKSVGPKKSDTERETRSKPVTRSKRRSSGDAVASKTADPVDGKRKKKAKLSWLRPSGKQPSIFSKFRRVGKISSTVKLPNKPGQGTEPGEGQRSSEKSSEEERPQNMDTPKKRIRCPTFPLELDGLDLMENLFQGQLVLRTRCLECESFTERREDFQDISVPVLEDSPSSPHDLCSVSPDPKPELKTLTWAIGQFASVERIVGEDKYFCETCHHYTEAERSLLFDKTPEVITIHLKRFSANSLELDPYAGLSKVNTPLQTPLTLSLEEWCTRPSAAQEQRYQLFAVIMHSGVTISSGHYTAYVRMSDLRDVRPRLRDSQESEAAMPKKDQPLSYDDGEVSFNLTGRRGLSLPGGKTGSKKLSEGGVGLLGGQRRLSSYELGNGSPQTEKAAGAEGSKRRKTINSLSQHPEAGVKKEPGAGTRSSRALDHLLQYEGKWLLFDDCEVRLCEEEDFLRACSPETCSSSTPYLLFYRRM
uniref:Ubiquitin carboxyl-terminal hydrolase n=1 Tax=Tetraodon nigroviridis TaxID=99883 RepID=H3DL64_TETNG